MKMKSSDEDSSRERYSRFVAERKFEERVGSRSTQSQALKKKNYFTSRTSHVILYFSMTLFLRRLNQAHPVLKTIAVTDNIGESSSNSGRGSDTSTDEEADNN